MILFFHFKVPNYCIILSVLFEQFYIFYKKLNCFFYGKCMKCSFIFWCHCIEFHLRVNRIHNLEKWIYKSILLQIVFQMNLIPTIKLHVFWLCACFLVSYSYSCFLWWLFISFIIVKKYYKYQRNGVTKKTKLKMNCYKIFMRT